MRYHHGQKRLPISPGTYDAHGSVTSVNLKLNGQGMPVDDLEAMLPALGVVLPPKSQLKGGDLNTEMAIVGPVDRLVTTGTVRMQNTTLANFNLGSKLSAISSLSGKSAATGNDTTIQNFSSNVRVAPDGTRAENINLTVPSIGVVTGAGTVSPYNELAFKLNANIGGNGRYSDRSLGNNLRSEVPSGCKRHGQRPAEGRSQWQNPFRVGRIPSTTSRDCSRRNLHSRLERHGFQSESQDRAAVPEKPCPPHGFSCQSRSGMSAALPFKLERGK